MQKENPYSSSEFVKNIKQNHRQGFRTESKHLVIFHASKSE